MGRKCALCGLALEGWGCIHVEMNGHRLARPATIFYTKIALSSFNILIDIPRVYVWGL